VDGLGANCGRSLEMTEEAARKIREAAPDTPLIVKPNAGMPRMEGGQVVYDATPEQMAEYARRLVDELGVRIVGGCCGSTPEHVAAIARAVR